MTPERTRSLGRDAGRKLLSASRLAFALSFLLAMITPVWRHGLFTWLPVWRSRVSGQPFQIGVLALLPALAAITWVVGRLLEQPHRRWRWGPASITVPVVGLGALAMVRIWPIHIGQTAAITAIAIALLWFTYFCGLSDWPEGWSIGVLAILLALQGTIGTVQFAHQGSIGLSWLGEGALDPRGQGISVIEVAGRRWLRAYGLMPHPNVLGGYLSMSVLVCLGALGVVKPRTRPWLGLCILLGCIGLLFTFSRAAWMGTAAGLAYMAGVSRPWRRVDWRSRRARQVVGISGALLLVAAIMFVAAFGELLVTRLFRLGDPLEQRSLRDRVYDMGQAWSLIRTVPLKGTGTGYYVDALWAGVGEDRPPGFRKVHNVPLLAAAELGIAGAVVWLWMLLAAPIALIRQQQRPSQDTMRSRSSLPQAANALLARAGWAAAFVSALVLSMLDNYLYVPSVWWAALYLGLLAGQWAKGDMHALAREAHA